MKAQINEMRLQMLITANIRAEIQTKSPSDDTQKIYWAWSQKAFILIQQLEGHLQVIYFNSLILLIHSPRKYLSRPYHVSGTVLGTRGKMSRSDSEHIKLTRFRKCRLHGDISDIYKFFSLFLLESFIPRFVT